MKNDISPMTMEGFNLQSLCIDRDALSPIHKVVYMPTKTEQELWSSFIHVPRNLFVGVYRLREDYYNVLEAYNNELPPQDLIGTDVLVHKVEGDYGFVRDLFTLQVHKINRKFFRFLRAGEFYTPSARTVPSAVTTLNRRQAYLLIPQDKEERKGIYMTIEVVSDRFKISIRTPHEFAGTKRTTLITKDLPKGVQQATLFLWMLRGYLTLSEMVLYNSTFDIELENTFYECKLIKNAFK